MASRLVRLLALLAALFAFAWGRPAAAEPQEEASGTLAPRDVAVVIQPAALKLPPPPADFQRIDEGWLVLEFPSTVRDRVLDSC